MISHYAAATILNGLCGKSQYGAAPRAFLALSSAEPTANGQGVTEPVGNGYKRKQIGFWQDTYGQLMGTPSEGVITNTQEIHFDEATGAWGELKYVCIYSAETGGNLLAWGELENPISPVANTVPVIKVGELVISIT